MTQNFFCNSSFQDLQKELNIFTSKDLWELNEKAETINVGNRGAVVLSKHKTQNESLYIKMYYYKKPDYRYFRRTSRAFREKQSYDFFSNVGIPHPEVVFCGEERKWGKLHWAIIATKEVDSSIDLVKLFLDKTNGNELRSKLLKNIGFLAGSMHQENFIHGTFRFRNLLWQLKSEKVFFIDCPGGTKSNIPWGRSVIFDLICIYKDIRALCSLEEWQYFIDGYTGKIKSKVSWESIPKICVQKFGPPPQLDWDNLIKTDGLFR